MAIAEQILVRDKLYIGGEWVEPSGDGTIEVVNPATEEVVGTVPRGEAADVDLAVATAKRAFADWSATDAEARAHVLAKAADLIEELGFTPVDGLSQHMAAFLEAGLGLFLVALLITYLPTIYAGFQRREVLVTLASIQAGTETSPCSVSRNTQPSVISTMRPSKLPTRT